MARPSLFEYRRQVHPTPSIPPDTRSELCGPFQDPGIPMQSQCWAITLQGKWLFRNRQRKFTSCGGWLCIVHTGKQREVSLKSLWQITHIGPLTRHALTGPPYFRQCINQIVSPKSTSPQIQKVNCYL